MHAMCPNSVFKALAVNLKPIRFFENNFCYSQAVRRYVCMRQMLYLEIRTPRSCEWLHCIAPACTHSVRPICKISRLIPSNDGTFWVGPVLISRSDPIFVGDRHPLPQPFTSNRCEFRYSWTSPVCQVGRIVDVMYTPARCGKLGATAVALPPVDPPIPSDQSTVVNIGRNNSTGVIGASRWRVFFHKCLRRRSTASRRLFSRCQLMSTILRSVVYSSVPRSVIDRYASYSTNSRTTKAFSAPISFQGRSRCRPSDAHQ
jgi:hypothetical protein